MSSMMKQTTYSAPGTQILAIPDHYVSIAQVHTKAVSGSVGLAVLEDGRYIVKAGTIWPANDSTAVGIVLNDYDVTDGDQIMAVVTHGFIKTSALPAVPSANAVTALKQISFLPYTDMDIALELVDTALEIDAGEAQNTTHAISLVLTGATFRDGATAESGWTITGESTTKVAVDSITLNADKDIVTFNTKNSAATVAGTVTIKPLVTIISTNKTISDAVTLITVNAGE